ncbi:hypothetical protein K8R43_06365 [archaeon]|nr:hypothetical protein [archaeon]
MKLLDWVTKNLGITKEVVPCDPKIFLIISFIGLVLIGFVVMLLTEGDIIITVLTVTVFELIVKVILFMKHAQNLKK